MYYALVHYLDSYSSKIDAVREKHDPRIKVTAPHLTFIFPVDVNIGEKNVILHIQTVLKNWEPFKITLKGIQISWDRYIFLTVSEGKKQIVELHDQLYTGPLARHLRADIPYIPHVTLGITDEDKAQQVLNDVTAMNIQQDILIDALQLIRCVDDRTPHEWEYTFHLENH